MNLSIVKNDICEIVKCSDNPLNFLNKDLSRIDTKKDTFPVLEASIRSGGVVSVKGKEFYRRDIALTLIQLKPPPQADYASTVKEIEDRYHYNSIMFDNIRDYLTHPQFRPLNYNEKGLKRGYQKHGNMEVSLFEDLDQNLNGCAIEQAIFSILTPKNDMFNCCSTFDKKLIKQ